MPVRSLTSSVLKWPDRDSVVRALTVWAQRLGAARSDLLRVGYFGSYATGQWGVGSDLDLVLVVSRTDRPFIERASRWDATGLPVPADVIVYTPDEWDAVLARADRFARVMADELKWVWSRDGNGDA
ncbi:nucleotidyltransferase domain-containing protein [bacterium]|nr:nucleotidyltransferase domain-containing protein [bacterium]